MKLLMLMLAACASTAPSVKLTEEWPAKVGDYDDVTEQWSRSTNMHRDYQEALRLTGIFKSPAWREAHAIKEASDRKLTGEARDALLAQAKAEAAGPYEVELLVSTWDRAENDLDRGKRSVWRVVLVDDSGKEILPLEIVRDKRPPWTLRAEFPTLEDFTIPYIVRFPRDTPLLGDGVKQLRLRMSSERGGVELRWSATAS